MALPRSRNLKNPGAEAVRNVVSRYYADMSCSNAAFVRAFESHFWPGATVSTVWKPTGYDKRHVVVTSVHDFVAQTPEGACSEPIFEEKMETAEVKIHNGLARSGLITKPGLESQVHSSSGTALMLSLC